MDESEYQTRRMKDQAFEAVALILIIFGMIAYNKLLMYEPKDTKPVSYRTIVLERTH